MKIKMAILISCVVLILFSIPAYGAVAGPSTDSGVKGGWAMGYSSDMALFFSFQGPGCLSLSYYAPFGVFAQTEAGLSSYAAYSRLSLGYAQPVSETMELYLSGGAVWIWSDYEDLVLPHISVGYRSCAFKLPVIGLDVAVPFLWHGLYFSYIPGIESAIKPADWFYDYSLTLGSTIEYRF